MASPFVGHWGDFFHLRPILDYSGAPQNLQVTLTQNYTNAKVCWESSVAQYGAQEVRRRTSASKFELCY